MSNSKTNISQMLEVYSLWSHGIKSRRKIHSRMTEKFQDEVVSLATQNRWIKEFIDNASEDIIQDSLFQWHLLDIYGIPWQEGKLVRYLSDEYFEITNVRASGRETKWIWRNWYLTDGANLTPHDDISFFWKVLIEKSIKDADREKLDRLSTILNWEKTFQEYDPAWTHWPTSD